MEKYHFATVISKFPHDFEAIIICSDVSEIGKLKEDLQVIDSKALVRDDKVLPTKEVISWRINIANKGDLRYWLIRWLYSRGWESVNTQDHYFSNEESYHHFKRRFE